MKQFTACPRCRGLGKTPSHWIGMPRKCWECNGRGKVELVPLPDAPRAHTVMRAAFAEPTQIPGLTAARGDTLEALITDCIVQDFENDQRCERILRDLETRIRIRCRGTL